MDYIPTTDTHFCSYQPLELITVPIGHEAVCEIRVSDTGYSRIDFNRTLCEDTFDGIWMGSSRDGYRRWGPCRSKTAKVRLICFLIHLIQTELPNFRR